MGNAIDFIKLLDMIIQNSVTVHRDIEKQKEERVMCRISITFLISDIHIPNLKKRNITNRKFLKIVRKNWTR